MAKQLPYYCLACDRQAALSGTTIDSMMLTDTLGGLSDKDSAAMMIRCQLGGHRYNYSNFLAQKPRMVKLALNEKQPLKTIALTVWVYPEVLEVLRQRYPQNLLTTLCAILTAVADPDTVMIEGEHGRALKEAGVLKGRDIVGLGAEVKRLHEEVEQLKIREKALAPMFQMFGGMMKAAGMPVAENADGGLVNPFESEVDPAAVASGEVGYERLEIPRQKPVPVASGR